MAPLPSPPFRFVPKSFPLSPVPLFRSLCHAVRSCSFLCSLRTETKNAFHWNGCKPEGRDGNGNETEGRKDGNGKAIKAERKGMAFPPFLPPSFPAFLPFVPFPFTHARKKTEFPIRSSLIFCHSSRFYFRSSKTGFPFQLFISHLQKQKRKKYENEKFRSNIIIGCKSFKRY